MTMACGESFRRPVARARSTLGIMAAGAAWRMFGTRRSAEILLDAMSGGNEQHRMLAGMSLVKAGRRSFELIEHKIAAGEAAPPVVRLLPDIDDRKSREILGKLACGEHGELRDTAIQCIDMLDRIDTVEKDDR